MTCSFAKRTKKGKDHSLQRLCDDRQSIKLTDFEFCNKFNSYLQIIIMFVSQQKHEFGFEHIKLCQHPKTNIENFKKNGRT